MDLSKDNKNIYTVDRENYAEYMKESRIEVRNLLSSFIKFLLFILFIVLSYFFYKIVKVNLSFSEVFNKKELFSTYELLHRNEHLPYIEKENHREVLAQKRSLKVEELKETAVLAVTKKCDNSIIEKKEMERTKEAPTQTILSDDYLKLMTEELNSI